MTSRFQELDPPTPLPLLADAQRDASVHCWSTEVIDALTLADVVKRPLLVRGEPGTGKTQLARAAAQHLGWALHAETIHPRYEAQDLVYRFDAVRRLADAQAQRELDDSEYFEPGPIWKAFGWDSANGYGSCRGQAHPAGHVILIDEIDKADSDLPNSLLEVLGQRSLWIAPLARLIGGPGVAAPLIVITTNEERELPPAFLRRCVVLNLAPDPAMTYLRWLVERGRAHFGVVDGDVGAAAPDRSGAVARRRATGGRPAGGPRCRPFPTRPGRIPGLAPGLVQAGPGCRGGATGLARPPEPICLRQAW